MLCALVPRPHDDECQVDHHVGRCHQGVDGVAVEDVALLIGGLRPPARGGSNGRRAIPTMPLTAGSRSSAVTAEIPISPVGPVTATVIPTWDDLPRRAAPETHGLDQKSPAGGIQLYVCRSPDWTDPKR